MKYLQAEQIISQITEEELHLFLLANCKRFGINEIIESSFNTTPDIIGIDTQSNQIKIEIELKLSNLFSHVDKHQENSITHCFYILNDVKETFQRKIPIHIKLNQINLTQLDMENIKRNITKKIGRDFGIKLLIQYFVVSGNPNSVKWRTLNVLINQFIYAYYGLGVNDLFEKRGNKYPTYKDIERALRKLPISYILELLKYFDIYQDKFIGTGGYRFYFLYN